MNFDAADIVEQGKNIGRSYSTATRKRRKLSKSDQFDFHAKKRCSVLNLMIAGLILVAFIMTLSFLFVFTELSEHVNKISYYVAQKSPFTACSLCTDIKVIGGEEYTKFEKWTDGNGCLRLTITCGLEQGTEAIIQWFNDDKNMGASFMERFGQSNVIRSLECNARGRYELFENGHRDEITKIECIVVLKRNEL
ncbi:hypothetical protein niasHT_014832 [Heterodera trifolii]|uniref:Effector protein n=1 Tax=Heterodera trifolii TaxID=157864 RepID=A0ABD2L6M3_9BILA